MSLLLSTRAPAVLPPCFPTAVLLLIKVPFNAPLLPAKLEPPVPKAPNAALLPDWLMLPEGGDASCSASTATMALHRFQQQG
jgi:hypothetical protein